MIDFQGRVALVTGAGRGLGFAYARLLAERGANVVLNDVGADADGQGRDPAVAEGAAATLRSGGLAATAASGSIESRVGCRHLVEDVLSAHGKLDVLIHNAGWVGYQPIEELDERFLARIIALGVEAPLWLAQAAWSAMVAQGYGRILLTTSDRALYPEYAQVGLAAYAAAKIAAVGIANILAREGAPHGILVNTISPVAKTRMWGVEGEPDELRPDAVAPSAVFLVSDACRDSAWVLRASNGQFHATRAQEAAGVDYPRNLNAVTAVSPEQVAKRWAQIAPRVPEVRSASARIAIETASAVQAVLGESPVWSERRQRLLWVDTVGQELHAFDPGSGRDETLATPDVIGFVAENPADGLVVAQGCDLARVGASGEVERFATAPDGGPGYRLNDGKYDAQGRLWIGLMADDLREGSGILYRYDPDGSWHRCDDGFTLVNGLDWSRDGGTFYVTDSRQGVIYAYDFDVQSGEIDRRREFARIDASLGKPDGLTVDKDGHLLSVLFDGSAILRIDPEGRIVQTIALPAPRPTSCAFSSDGRHLYVTTARLDLSEAELAASPRSGSLLRLDYDAVRNVAPAAP